jgi:hypoxanthine phosphoribosyltransferase
MADNLVILFDEQTIGKKVEELALQISRDYAGKELVLVCILKGAFTFTADLMRQLTIPATIEFIQVASYRGSMVSLQDLVIKQDIVADIKGRHVLLVDTIIDTGKTLACVCSMFRNRGPSSLGVAALLDKKPRRILDVDITYCGFEIPDRFVVGYGLDFNEQYRNLPYIAALDAVDLQ